MSIDVPDLFPLLIPTTLEFIAYEGFRQDYSMFIRNPSKDGRFQASDLKLDSELQQILGSRLESVYQKLSQSDSILNFLIDFRDILDIVARSLPPSASQLPYAFYELLISELQTIGWDRICDIEESLTKFSLSFRDGGDREHMIRVSMPADYPRQPPECFANLPVSVALRWPLGGGSLRDVLSQYEQTAAEYEPLFDVLDDFAKHTWILEPSEPTYATAMRRISIAKHASLHIDIDPKHPRAVPECRLLGADSVVAELKEKLGRNLERWNEQIMPRENLEMMLEMQFPSPTKTAKDDFEGECMICYAYLLGGAGPDRVCDNPQCSKAFHRACLYEWLQALPDHRQSFDTVFGSCPYCYQNIACKIPNAR